MIGATGILLVVLMVPIASPEASISGVHDAQMHLAFSEVPGGIVYGEALHYSGILTAHCPTASGSTTLDSKIRITWSFDVDGSKLDVLESAITPSLIEPAFTAQECIDQQEKTYEIQGRLVLGPKTEGLLDLQIGWLATSGDASASDHHRLTTPLDGTVRMEVGDTYLGVGGSVRKGTYNGGTEKLRYEELEVTIYNDANVAITGHVTAHPDTSPHVTVDPIEFTDLPSRRLLPAAGAITQEVRVMVVQGGPTFDPEDSLILHLVAHKAGQPESPVANSTASIDVENVGVTPAPSFAIAILVAVVGLALLRKR